MKQRNYTVAKSFFIRSSAQPDDRSQGVLEA